MKSSESSGYSGGRDMAYGQEVTHVCDDGTEIVLNRSVNPEHGIKEHLAKIHIGGNYHIMGMEFSIKYYIRAP